MMSHTDLPVSFWGYALETTAYILNRAPSKSVKTTPFEEWHRKKPKLSHLKIWGCEAYVRKLQPDKLESKADKCIFVGYPRETVGYTFYNQSEGKTFVAKTGCFLEKEFLSKELSGSKIDLNEMIDQSLQVEEMAMEVVPEPSSVVGAEENVHHDIHNDRDIHDDHDQDEEDPIVPRRSSRCELERSNGGTRVREMARSHEIRDRLHVCQKKTDADGNVSAYKARLVVKGFRQIQGVDYEETFSPVAMLKSIRILLAIAAYHDYEIWQMDVKNAFLNGNIEEEL